MGGDMLAGDGVFITYKNFPYPLRLETGSSRGEEKRRLVRALAFGEPALAKPGKKVFHHLDADGVVGGFVLLIGDADGVLLGEDVLHVDLRQGRNADAGFDQDADNGRIAGTLPVVRVSSGGA